MTTQGKNLLEKEMKTYMENRDNLLVDHDGQFVLIHEDDIMGTFDTESDAISEGYRELGNVPFLVKKITDVEKPLHYTSNLLAV